MALSSKRMLTGATLLAMLAGCSAAASPNPDASTSPVASGSLRPAASPSISTSPRPSVAPTPTPIPSVGREPSGPWSQVTWIAAGAAVPLGPNNVSVVGWSGGFVAFDVNGGDDGNGNVTPIVVRSSASADGLGWSAPRTLDPTGLADGVEFAGMVEGPRGLVAIGHDYPGTCGGPAGVNALWSSPDGLDWTRIPLPKAFRANRVVTIAGGSAGYLATGITSSDGNYRGIWASHDGATWRTLPPPSATSGTAVVNDGTSFAGGFVLAGAILGGEGCGGPQSLHPSVWWSADGQSWARETIGGASTADDVQMTAQRLSDQALVVVETHARTSTMLAWVSRDGRAWSRIGAPSAALTRTIRSDGHRAAILIDPESGSGPPTVAAVDDAGIVTQLAQHGPGPVASEDSLGWTSAIGPTGIVVVRYDGSDVWLGIPG